MIKLVLSKIIYILDLFYPKNSCSFVFASFPDLSDNSYAMFKYLYKLKYSNGKKNKFIWLLADDSRLEDYKRILNKNMNLSDKEIKNIIFVKKNSIMGLLYYFGSKYVFFTHGIYPYVKIPSNHIVINLWHGMPLKTIGLLDDPDNPLIPASTYTIATSTYFQDYMSKAFGLALKQTIISGQPRCDLLFEDKDCLRKLNIIKEKYNKIFLWTPTYRQSILGTIRTDGKELIGLPVISKDYSELNNYMKSINSIMTIKLHPMDILNNTTFSKYSNVSFLTNSDLEMANIQLYELVNEVDVLLTDFSSIYIDYLLLDRPIAFIMDDFDKYSDSRGFVMDAPKKYMPGAFLSSKKELYAFLDDCIQDIDSFIDKRKEVNKIFNEINIKFSENLWTKVNKE